MRIHVIAVHIFVHMYIQVVTQWPCVRKLFTLGGFVVPLGRAVNHNLKFGDGVGGSKLMKADPMVE